MYEEKKGKNKKGDFPINSRLVELFKIFMSWLKTVCVQISKKLRKNVWNATG